jgi:vancomycin resistance protein VanJ
LRLIRISITLYSLLVFIWIILYIFYGDHFWWLAIINSFTPWIFSPVVIIFPLTIYIYRRISWWRIFIPIVFFICLHGYLFLPNWTNVTITTDPSFTIMTFNMWGGSHTLATAQTIEQNGFPDIVVIQELSPIMEPLLLKTFGQVYPYHQLDSRMGGGGMGILSRYPLQVLDTKIAQTDRSFAQAVRVILGSRHLIVYNIHPVATNPLVAIEQGGSIADEVQQRGKERDQFVAALLADISQHGEPVIVAGDFNSTPYNNIYHVLTKGLNDTQITSGWGLRHTFPAYAGQFRGFPTPPRLMRLDMILVSPELVALDNFVAPNHGESDHLPVVGRLTWKAY